MYEVGMDMTMLCMASNYMAMLCAAQALAQPYRGGMASMYTTMVCVWLACAWPCLRYGQQIHGYAA